MARLHGGTGRGHRTELAWLLFKDWLVRLWPLSESGFQNK
jgi:hypothetical protein